MTEQEQPPEPTIDSIRGGINEKIAFLLDYNARATVVLRKQAKDFESIAEFFQNMRDRSLDIADDIATLARLAADLTGDIITAEFGELEEDDTEQPED